MESEMRKYTFEDGTVLEYRGDIPLKTLEADGVTPMRKKSQVLGQALVIVLGPAKLVQSEIGGDSPNKNEG